MHLGPFARLVSGPQLHRIHHSRLATHFDRNYAAFLPIYDQLFRTYYYPRRGEFPPTGVEGEAEMTSLREAALLPFMPPRIPWVAAGDMPGNVAGDERPKAN